MSLGQRRELQLGSKLLAQVALPMRHACPEARFGLGQGKGVIVPPADQVSQKRGGGKPCRFRDVCCFRRQHHPVLLWLWLLSRKPTPRDGPPVITSSEIFPDNYQSKPHLQAFVYMNHMDKLAKGRIVINSAYLLPFYPPGLPMQSTPRGREQRIGDCLGF